MLLIIIELVVTIKYFTRDGQDPSVRLLCELNVV